MSLWTVFPRRKKTLLDECVCPRISRMFSKSLQNRADKTVLNDDKTIISLN